MPQQPTDPSGVLSSDIKPSVGERLGGILGAFTGANGTNGSLDDAIKQHHNERLQLAQRHRQEWSTYHSAATSGLDPQTGQPLSDDDKAKYESWANSAWDNYVKAAGVNPDAKKSLERNKGVIDRLTGLFKQHREANAGGAGGAVDASGGRDASTPPSAAGPVSAGDQAAMPAAPRAIPAYTAQVAADAPRVQGQLDEQLAFKKWKRMQDVLRENKIAENNALAAARSSGKTTPRPVTGGSIGVLDARGLATAGKIYLDTTGNPIDVTGLPDSMGLKGFVMKDDNNEWVTRYEPFSPNQATVTAGNETFVVSPMDKSKVPQGAGVDLGQHITSSTTATLDPVTNQTTISKRTPATPGLTPGANSRLPAAPRASATPMAAAAAPSSAPSPAKSPASTQGPQASLPPLDSAGHIPSTLPASSPQIIEGANQLLDGTDKDKLPAKTRELSAALARKYDWSQGKFTPKESTALEETSTFIDRFANLPALKVLDSLGSKTKLITVLEGAHRQGLIAGMITGGVSHTMNRDEQDFVDMYNQVVQTISGLRQITSPGRQTEAAIQRLLADLPNPKTTANSAEALRKLDLIREEIAIARKTRSWDHLLSKDAKGPAAASATSAAKPGISKEAQAYIDGIKAP